ncbi:hypothetical protein J8273_8980 [Carpediemonas membranifera]|uniref:Reverse transcriptase domain-containing protein n=1 Tax=Carpediemonas membranifera TaxID=201153 RepID=A0A8J6DX92_9EUKA|nr:hypothetical protein J8273_8980 [Carpediemonas membranifera]|eukprot:KAG9389679.1 hypothetical protein J8273_8980 [Carpediemonas membranifera]
MEGEAEEVRAPDEQGNVQPVEEDELKVLRKELLLMNARVQELQRNTRNEGWSKPSNKPSSRSLSPPLTLAHPSSTSLSSSETPHISHDSPSSALVRLGSALRRGLVDRGRRPDRDHRVATSAQAPTPIARGLRVPPTTHAGARQVPSRAHLQSQASSSLPIFTTPKSDGSPRLIHDLRTLNDVTKERRVFRLFGLKRLLEIAAPDDSAVKLDLRSGYYQLGVKPSDRTLLGFAYAGQFYQFQVLPFGWTAAPYVFQRVMISAASIISHRFGVKVAVYLDDWAVLAPQSHLKRVVPGIVKCMQQLGLILNLAKSMLTPGRGDRVPRLQGRPGRETHHYHAGESHQVRGETGRSSTRATIRAGVAVPPRQALVRVYRMAGRQGMASTPSGLRSPQHSPSRTSSARVGQTNEERASSVVRQPYDPVGHASGDRCHRYIRRVGRGDGSCHPAAGCPRYTAFPSRATLTSTLAYHRQGVPGLGDRCAPSARVLGLRPAGQGR